MRIVAGILLSIGVLAGVNGCRSEPTISDREVVERFSRLWHRSSDTWAGNTWFGVRAFQNPLDVWITQEIISEVRPDFIVEAGAFRGGSALLWATILEQINPDGRVITIDIRDETVEARKHPLWERRVEFLLGGSTDPDIVAAVAERTEGKSVIVILDSLHMKFHVLEEMRAYAPLVPVGSYLIVQDGALNGHPVQADHGPGPWEAIQEFLAENDEFVVDTARERLMLTYNPNGFLKRVKKPAAR